MFCVSVLLIDLLFALDLFGKVNTIADSNLRIDFKRVQRNLYKSIHEYVDESVHPCDDFYQHACGNWEKLNPIPEDAVDIKPIKAVAYRTDALLNQILASDERSGESDAERKARIFHSSCVNQTISNELGVRPLLNLVDSLGGWPALDSNWTGESFDWLETIALMRRYGDQILIKENVNFYKKNSDLSIIYLDQPILGLGSRTDYLDEAYSYRLEAYRTYIKRTLEILRKDNQDVANVTEEIVAFEKNLARILAASSERTNITLYASEVTIDQLELKVPGINWTKYLSTAIEESIPTSEAVVIKEFKYMNSLSDLVHRNDPRTVANYIFWRFVQFKAPRLSNESEAALQEYYNTLLGLRTSPPRWKVCVNDVSNHMREVIAGMFTKYAVSDDSGRRDEVADMMRNVKQALVTTINMTNWLDGTTKNLINLKLDKMSYQIGNAEEIESETEVNELYKNLTMVPENYFSNYLNLLRFSSRRKHARLRQPVDQWSNVSPDLMNAYYSLTKNRIFVPAGLLQQPIFDRFYTKAFNYGRMGALLGHEITHAIDNIGRNYDFDGHLKSWWNRTLIDRFNEQSECIKEQYSVYKVPNSKHLLDALGTLAENIADNGGLTVAYRAYRSLAVADGEKPEESDNDGVDEDHSTDGRVLNDDEVFFYSFAQLWCGRIRPEAVLTQMRRDPHSPLMWRVIGTISNSEDFSRVFNCSVGEPMNPIKKCKMW